MPESASRPTIKSSKTMLICVFEKKNQCPSPNTIIIKQLPSSVQKKPLL
jgi:hypothetical protein